MTEYTPCRKSVTFGDGAETWNRSVEIPDDAIEVEVEYSQEVRGRYGVEVFFLEPVEGE